MHRGTEKLRYLVEFRVEIFSMARRGSRVERSKRSCGEESGKLLRNRVKFFDKRCFIHRWSYPTWRWTAYTRSWYAEARGALSTIGWLYAEKALLHRRCAAFAIATEHHRYCHTPPYGSAAEWSPGWSALVSRWCWWSPPSCCGSEDQPFISSLYIFYFARYPSPSPSFFFFLLFLSLPFFLLFFFSFFLVLSILSNSSQFDEKTKNGMAREICKISRYSVFLPRRKHATQAGHRLVFTHSTLANAISVPPSHDNRHSFVIVQLQTIHDAVTQY